ncbi:MAG TPA: hypothetical protein VGJ20_13750 [Xanthobacteraceae bacterium]
MTLEISNESPEAALGAGAAAILLGTVTLSLLVTHKLVAPAYVAELMDEARLQLERSCGLPGSLGAAAQIARAHMRNVYRDIDTLSHMAAWREKLDGSR